MGNANADNVVAAMHDGTIDIVQMEVPDLNGILRAKFASAKKVAGGSKSAVCTVVYQFTPADDVWLSQHSSYDNGFPDVVGVPDLSTAIELPWRPGMCAVLYDVMYSDGRPFPLSPRNVSAGKRGTRPTRSRWRGRSATPTGSPTPCGSRAWRCFARPV